MKLDHGDLHLLRLTLKGSGTKGVDGWAKVSATVLPLLRSLPSDLIELKENADGSGLARLTANGETVLLYS